MSKRLLSVVFVAYWISILLDISIDVCIRNWTALHVFTATTVLLNRSLRENLDCIPLASSLLAAASKPTGGEGPLAFSTNGFWEGGGSRGRCEEDAMRFSQCLWLAILNQGIACQIPFLLSVLHWCYDQSESAQNCSLFPMPRTRRSNH